MTGSTRGFATWTWGFLFLGWFIFYLFTAPAVHVEADDAYLYAYQVEQDSLTGLLHPYHPLYLPLMRGLFEVGKSIGVADRSFELMTAVGAALAAAAVVLFSLILWKRLGVSKKPSIAIGGLLGFSYGFWRYAAEAEVYALALLLVLGLVWWIFGERWSVSHAAWGGVIALLAVLGHVLNIIPALVSAPLYLALRHGKKHVLAYLTVFLLASVPVAYAIGRVARVEYPNYATIQWPNDGHGKDPEIRELPIGAAALGHAVVSGGFLFVFPGYRDWISKRFPNQRLEGEKLVGARAWPHTGIAGSITLIIAVIAFGWTLCRGLAGVLPPISDPVALSTLSWLALYVAVIAYTGNLEQPEAWLLVLVPFWVLFAKLVYVGAEFRGNAVLLVFLPCALLLHNSVGGMTMLKNPESDRHRLKARWLLEHARETDVILTSESAGFTRYLKYYSDAEVVSLQQLSTSEVATIQEESVRSADRVFVTGEIVRQPSLLARSPEPWMGGSGSVVRRFRDATRLVHRGAWDGVFLLEDERRFSDSGSRE